ncbi:hypothetical protein, partial [Streptococcus oralis]|uniref:hypothetical protein n=1 Tax=Streptococcus oralis TaxID=1303 RepID=UPI000A52498D
MAYGIDFRKRVLAYVEEGLHVKKLQNYLTLVQIRYIHGKSNSANTGIWNVRNVSLNQEKSHW